MQRSILGVVNIFMVIPPYVNTQLLGKLQNIWSLIDISRQGCVCSFLRW
jgi:hypothetical protein